VTTTSDASPPPSPAGAAYDPDAYLAGLPIGVPQELPAGSAPSWEIFPFDGGAHLHLMLYARPAGMQQLRGSFLATWEGLLPRVPEEQRRAAHRHLASALAADGGKAYVK
jgi:hypothetical protein